MKNIIDDILNINKELFGNNPTAEKINTGFTNSVYSVNDSFIIKICTDTANEPNFLKEINFYKANNHNHLLPRLYHSDTTKKLVPFYYEISEKIKGVSLYNLWHTFSEEEREGLTKQLCLALEQIHSVRGEKYNWADFNKQRFIPLYTKACKMSLFSHEEKQLLENVFEKFNHILHAEDFVLVHNDIHFDNVIYTENGIKLIDFERSMYAPADFELDIIYRMVRKPWKFADENTEKLTDPAHYKNIIKYMKKYYPGLFSAANLACRLAVYDMIYFLRQYVNAPCEKQLKEDVLFAALCAVKGDNSFLELD